MKGVYLMEEGEHTLLALLGVYVDKGICKPARYMIPALSTDLTRESKERN